MIIVENKYFFSIARHRFDAERVLTSVESVPHLSEAQHRKVKIVIGYDENLHVVRENLETKVEFN